MTSSKPQIAVLVGRPTTSKFSKSLIEQMSILKQYEKDYDLIFFTREKTSSGMQYIQEVAGITFASSISYRDWYEDYVYKKHYPTWLDMIENCSEFDKHFTNLKHVVVFGGILSSAAGLCREKNKLERYMTTQQQMNFNANGSVMSGIMVLVRQVKLRDAVFHEICYDPCENSLNLTSIKPEKYHLYHGYDIPRYEFERLDSLQNYLLSNSSSSIDDCFEDSYKDIDLTFGFTAITSKREAQYDRMMSCLDLERTKMFVRHNKLGIDTFVNRDTYMSFIKRSKHTLLIPPYDMTQFSIYRFAESVYNNCLPLILEDVKTDEFRDSFGISQEMIDRITISYDQVNLVLPDSEREELLSYFRQKCFSNERKLNI